MWNDAGTLRLTRGPAWSSDTSRGIGAGTSEIELINGFWLNKQAITNGPAADRGTLVGSFRSNGSSQLVDSKTFRWLSNVYNQALRPMQVVESAARWSYTTNSFRQANNSAANQLDFLQSLPGGCLTARVIATYSNTNTGTYGIVGIDIDSVNTTTIVGNVNSLNYVTAANALVVSEAYYNGFPGLGRHTAIWKEYSIGTGTGTFYGTAGGSVLQSGIYGEIWN